MRNAATTEQEKGKKVERKRGKGGERERKTAFILNFLPHGML
jgi:hypothetical protein